METRELKTRADWDASRCNLDTFLQVGDYVDEAMAEYFIGVLPPAHWTADLIQIGEPSSHVKGKPTYATLHRRYGEPWQYCGDCYLGSFAEAG
jgi:hypothetical protein